MSEKMSSDEIKSLRKRVGEVDFGIELTSYSDDIRDLITQEPDIFASALKDYGIEENEFMGWLDKGVQPDKKVMAKSILKRLTM